MIDYSNTFTTEPTEQCPYCDEECHADFVDNGFGPYAVQCGPYHCEACGASEIGPEGASEGFEATVTAEENRTGWYAGDKVSPYANTVGGVIVDHKKAKMFYDVGMLDEKEYPTYNHSLRVEDFSKFTLE